MVQINARKEFVTSTILLNKMNAINKEGISARLKSHKFRMSSRDSSRMSRKDHKMSVKLKQKIENVKLRHPVVKRLKSWNEKPT